LAQIGHAILIGRGANIVTAKLPDIFHVRLVGSLERRIKRIQESRFLERREAAQLAEREDLARRRYLRQFFNKDIDDPLLYHLVINTDLITADDAARMIALALAPKALALAA
jgi:cytidylate kinase